MRKYLLLLLVPFLFLIDVKAEDITTTYQVQEQEFIPISNFDISSDEEDNNYGFGLNTWIYTDFSSFYSISKNKEIFDNLYDEVMTAYSLVRNDYPNYKLSVLVTSSSSSNFKLYAVGLRLRIYDTSSADNEIFTINKVYSLGTYNSLYVKSHSFNTGDEIYYIYEDAGYYGCYNGNNCNGFEDELPHVPFNSIALRHNSNGNFYIPTLTFMTNTHHTIKNTTDIWELYNKDSELVETYEAGDEYPFIYQDGDFSLDGSYVTVNLDNYEYVLLSLKDYNQSKAFSSNLKVKGQIGISPIYNYGQTSKDSITNSSWSDRCNSSYADYTSYPLYIIKSDLENNAIYAVKSCVTDSSFKFDSSIFDITYITSENKDNPTVTIAGKTYNVIPYDELPTTATQNEENNVIPGESENAITGESVGLSAIIKNTQKKLSEIWNIFTYFMSFVNQIFSTLPEEIRTVLVASFTIGCVLGLIKILKA